MTSNIPVMAFKPFFSYYQFQKKDDNSNIKNLSKKNIRAVIFEIDLVAAKCLTRQIYEINPNIIIEKTFTDLAAIAEYYHLAEHQPELLFTEVNVGSKNCFELFKCVEVKSKVIFTTTNSKFAVNAFRLNAVDYLIKPIQMVQLSEAIEKAIIKQNTITKKGFDDQYKKRILIRWTNKLHTILCNDISYILFENKISYIYLINGERVPSLFKLQELEEMLDPTQFFRVNRQFIVNYESISEISSLKVSKIILKLNKCIKPEITLSVEKTKAFKIWINK